MQFWRDIWCSSRCQTVPVSWCTALSMSAVELTMSWVQTDPYSLAPQKCTSSVTSNHGWRVQECTDASPELASLLDGVIHAMWCPTSWTVLVAYVVHMVTVVWHMLYHKYFHSEVLQGTDGKKQLVKGVTDYLWLSRCAFCTYPDSIHS
jgi:hypothetical protein